MSRRTVVKWLHWLSAALILYFFLVEPEDNRTDPGGALSTHAGVGLVLAVVAALWLGLYLRKGLAGRPGPKLPAWGRRLHPAMHKALQWGLPAVVATGALAGLAAPFVIHAFGALPVNPGIGAKGVHELAQNLHELMFDGLMLIVLAHTGFHVWRHVRLKDNALRIMLPRALHKYL